MLQYVRRTGGAQGKIKYEWNSGDGGHRSGTYIREKQKKMSDIGLLLLSRPTLPHHGPNSIHPVPVALAMAQGSQNSVAKPPQTNKHICL